MQKVILKNQRQTDTEKEAAYDSMKKAEKRNRETLYDGKKDGEESQQKGRN